MAKPCRWSYPIICCFLLLSILSAHASTSLQFTEEEQQFLAAQHEIRIGIDPKFVPFEFIDDNQAHSGIAADVLSLVSERTGLRFVYDSSLGWTESVQLAREGSIDLLAAVGYTDARAEYLTYLEPYVQFQRAIVVQRLNSSIVGFSDLRGRQVAVQQDSSHEGFLLTYPDISLRRYTTVQDALLAVNQGSEVAFVGNEATSVYLARTLGLTELRVIPITEGGPQQLYMAVRSDLPIVASIIQKTLDSITENEYSEIFSSWIRYDTRIDYTPIIRIGASVVSIIMLAFAISLYWIIRLRKEVRLREAAQMRAETADIEKSRYLARISHEVRTPLNGIKGMSYLLEKTSLSSTQKRYVQTITHASQTMQYIINDILEFSRLDEGRITLEHVPFTLDDVLQNCISIESYLLRQKGLEMKLTQNRSVPQYMLGDPTRLSQVLINLINNAVKFTEEGSIEVSVQAEMLDEQRYTYIFKIIDTGIGMDEQQLGTMFTPFVQANETIHRKYGGSGLGLSIVKGLVEKMGGTISVESTLHKGSTFTVSIPFELDHRGVAEERERRKSIDFSHLKVLLVLSDKALADRIESLLDNYDISFDGVTSPALAAAVIKNTNDYDLVMLELENQNSIEKELEIVLRNSNQKVLVLMHEEKSEDQEPQFDLVLPLPLVNSVLLNALLQLFGRGEDHSLGEKEHDLEQASLPLTVLVVEDNPTNQMIAQELITRAGFTAIITKNGKEGYERFCEEQDSIDVVLMDLHMDVMDGYESSTLIRQKNKQVPIIITSADILESVTIKCREIGVTDLIAKPYDPDLLIDTIKLHGFPYFKQMNKHWAIDTKLGIRQVGGDPKIYTFLLTSFLSETQALLSDLKTAVQSHQYDLVSELVHRCKGSCGAIGAIKAQKLCITVQNNLQDTTLLEKLQNHLEEVVSEAESLLKRQETAEQG